MLLSSRLKCWIALSTIVLKWRVLSTFLSSGSRPLVWKLIITCTCIKEILLVNNIEAQFIDIIMALILWQRVVATYRYWELANQTSPVIKRMSYSELSSHITLFLKCYVYAWQWWFFSSKLIFSIHVIVHFFYYLKYPSNQAFLLPGGRYCNKRTPPPPMYLKGLETFTWNWSMDIFNIVLIWNNGGDTVKRAEGTVSVQ